MAASSSSSTWQGVVLSQHHTTSVRPAAVTPCRFSIGESPFELAVDNSRSLLDVHIKRLEVPCAAAQPVQGSTLREEQQPARVALECALLIAGDKDGKRKTYVSKTHSLAWNLAPGAVRGWAGVFSISKLCDEQADGRTVSVMVHITAPNPSPRLVVKMTDHAVVRLGRTAAKPFCLTALLDTDDGFSDCTVRAGPSGPTYHCHRALLAAASDAFAAFFSTSSSSFGRDAAHQELVLHDTTSEVLQLLLQYIYGCQELHVQMWLLLPLLKLADEWCVEGLCADISAWLGAANLLDAAAAALLRQARMCGLTELEAGPVPELAEHISCRWDKNRSSISKLSGWQPEDMAALLTACDGSYGAFELAAHWVQQQAASVAAEAEAEEEAATETALASAVGEAAATPGSEQPPAKRARTAAAPSDVSSAATPTAVAPEAAAAAYEKGAWAVLLPLVKFMQFTDKQLSRVRRLPGVSSIGEEFNTLLLEVWEQQHDSSSKDSD